MIGNIQKSDFEKCPDECVYLFIYVRSWKIEASVFQELLDRSS